MSLGRRWVMGGLLSFIATLLLAALLLSAGQVTTARGQLAPTPAAADPLRARIAGLSPKPAWIKPDPAKVFTRIGVGSCLDQKKPQPIWADIIKDKPDLFLMLGDNVYGSSNAPDATALIDAYAQQATQIEFAAARAAMPFLATWDDHDYGRNDGGSSYQSKEIAADAFRAFWQMQDDLPKKSGAIYYARVLGPVGRRVQILMLDPRYDRSDLSPKPENFVHWGRYGPDGDPAKQMMSAEQWDWLEQQLKVPAEVRLLVSGIQVLAEGHGFERWGNLPRERERLLKLIDRTGAKGVVMLSGDRHHAAVYRLADITSYPLYEMTASSLNLPYGASKDARMAPLASDIVSVENYGMVDIDWTRGTVSLAIKVIGGETKVTQTIAFKEIGLMP